MAWRAGGLQLWAGSWMVLWSLTVSILALLHSATAQPNAFASTGAGSSRPEALQKQIQDQINSALKAAEGQFNAAFQSAEQQVAAATTTATSTLDDPGVDAVSCISSPTNAAIPDSLGRLWGWEFNHSCLFRTSTGAPMHLAVQQPQGAQQPQQQPLVPGPPPPHPEPAPSASSTTYTNVVPCTGQPTVKSAVPDVQGRLWGWEVGPTGAHSCMYLQVDGQPMYIGMVSPATSSTSGAASLTTSGQPASPAPQSTQQVQTPTSTPAPQPGNSGPDNAVPSAQTVPSTTPNCTGTPASGNTAADADGRLWGWQNGQSCIWRTATGAVLQLSTGTAVPPSSTTPAQVVTPPAPNNNISVPTVQQVPGTFPNCTGTPGASNTVIDSQGRIWGWENNSSCIYRTASGAVLLTSYRSGPTSVPFTPPPAPAPLAAPVKTNSTASTVPPIPITTTNCTAAITSNNTVADTFGRLWGWEKNTSCIYRTASGAIVIATNSTSATPAGMPQNSTLPPSSQSPSSEGPQPDMAMVCPAFSTVQQQLVTMNATLIQLLRYQDQLVDLVRSTIAPPPPPSPPPAPPPSPPGWPAQPSHPPPSPPPPAASPPPPPPPPPPASPPPVPSPAMYGVVTHWGAPSSGADHGVPPGFVQAVGRQLYLDGSPWYFQGTNIYYLGVSSIDTYKLDKAGNDTIEGIVKVLASKGIRVIRTWGFGHGWDHMAIDAAGRWTLKPAAWARLDFFIAMASRYGVKVVLPMVNFEPDLTGMDFYVANTLGSGKERELFYADSRVWVNYQGYVWNMINHWNPLTGRLYKDEPAILAWGLANEPHTTDNFEQKGPRPSAQYGDAGIQVGEGQIPGRLVTQWLCRAASYVKSLDPWHLVTTGEEGYRTHGPWTSAHQWINNGMKGVDFESNVKCPDIDYVTLHVYPDNWDIPFNNFQWVVPNVLQDRAALAAAANKPIVLEEYGCCKASDYLGKRSTVFKAIHDAVNNLGFAGSIVWQMMPWNGLSADHNYDFTPSDDGGAEIIAQANYMNSRRW